MLVAVLMLLVFSGRLISVTFFTLELRLKKYNEKKTRDN